MPFRRAAFSGDLQELGRTDALGFLRLILEEHGFSTEQAQSLAEWAWGQIVDDVPMERVALELPQRREFRERFPAIHRMQQEGLTPPTVDQYLRFERDVQQITMSWGLPPEFRDQQHITQLLMNEVSPQELSQRIEGLAQDVLGRADEIREFYSANFGVSGLSDGAILASAFTPGVSPHDFEQRIRAAGVGGTAARFGFDRDLGRVQRLIQAGVGIDQAEQFFGAAQTQVPTLRQLVGRHFDPQDEFDITQLEQAVIFQDPDQQRRIRRLGEQEEALFSPSMQFGDQQRDRRRRGLRQR